MNDNSQKTGFTRWQAYPAGATALVTAMAALIVSIGTLRDAWCNNIGVFCSTNRGPTIEPSGSKGTVNLPPNNIPPPPAKPFAPIPYEGKGISFDPNNNKYEILINYRAERQEDAERIVGALKQAGYVQSDGVQSTLEEVFAPNMKNPGTTLIKTTSFARPVVDDVSRVVQSAVPLKARSVFTFESDVTFQRGHIQIDLF